MRGMDLMENDVKRIQELAGIQLNEQYANPQAGLLFDRLLVQFNKLEDIIEYMDKMSVAQDMKAAGLQNEHAALKKALQQVWEEFDTFLAGLEMEAHGDYGDQHG